MFCESYEQTNAPCGQKAVRWFMRLAATLTSRRPVRVASGGQSVTGTGFCPITSGSPLSVSFHQSPGWNSVPRGERPARVYAKQNCPELYECVCKVRSYLADNWCKSAVTMEPLGHSSVVLHLHRTVITLFANAVWLARDIYAEGGRGAFWVLSHLPLLGIMIVGTATPCEVSSTYSISLSTYLLDAT